MNTKQLLQSMVGQHAKPSHGPEVQAHVLSTLTKRLLATGDEVLQFLRNGTLRPIGELYPGGPLEFSRVSLDRLRRAVLESVVAEVMDLSNGDVRVIELGARIALNDRVAYFAQPGPVELSRVPRDFSNRPGFIGNAVVAAKVISFSRYEEDDDRTKWVPRFVGAAGIAGAGLYATGKYAINKRAIQIGEDSGDAAKAAAYRAKFGLKKATIIGTKTAAGATRKSVGAILRRTF